MVNPVTARLLLPADWRIHPVFHASLLRPAATDPLPGQASSPPRPGPTEDINGPEPRWEVEKIVGISRQGRGFKYRVLWKGYPSHEATSEPALRIFEDTPNLVRQFHEEHPEAPRPEFLTKARDEPLKRGGTMSQTTPQRPSAPRDTT